MKKLFLSSLTAILMLGLGGCGSAAPSTPDPITIYQSYLEALNASDLDKAMSFVADDAVFIDPMGKYTGKEAIRAVYMGQMNIGGRWEASEIIDTNGRLDYQFKAFINDLLVSDTTGRTVVKDGKIIFDGNEYNWKAECDRDPSQSFCSDE